MIPFIIYLILQSLEFTTYHIFSNYVSLNIGRIARHLNVADNNLLGLGLPRPSTVVNHAHN